MTPRIRLALMVSLRGVFFVQGSGWVFVSLSDTTAFRTVCWFGVTSVQFTFRSSSSSTGWCRDSLTRVTKSYLLALGTTQMSSFFTKHWTKFLTHQTGNYPVTCFVSKPSRITLVELYIINTSYQKLPFGSCSHSFDRVLFLHKCVAVVMVFASPISEINN